MSDTVQSPEKPKMRRHGVMTNHITASQNCPQCSSNEVKFVDGVARCAKCDHTVQRPVAGVEQ